MSGYPLLILLASLVALGLAFRRTERAPSSEAADEPEVDIVVDLAFLRSRPAELDQRISELAALSGRATLGARMRSVQAAAEPAAPRPARIRRRARPLVASR